MKLKLTHQEDVFSFPLKNETEVLFLIFCGEDDLATHEIWIKRKNDFVQPGRDETLKEYLNHFDAMIITWEPIENLS